MVTINGCKWLSNSKALYFLESVEFEKVYVRFFINKVFKIVGSVSKVGKESISKIFFSGLRHFK